MHRRKDNYSDGARSKKETTRHYSFKGRNPSPPDRFGVKQKDIYRNVRVIQKNLVHVIGLPESLSGEDIASPEYFGKYGIVEKYSLYPITRNGNKKKIYSYTAYITFMTELEASLAIVALDGRTVGDRLLKLSFGTTKYCSHFTKDVDCPSIKECLYLHEWQKDNEVIIDEESSRGIFKDQFKIALNIMKEGLDTILKKKYSIDQDSEFPSIHTILHTLVDYKLIDEEALQQRLCQLDPSKKMNYMPHRKSFSSISTTFSNHKCEPVDQIAREDPVDQLIEEYLMRNLLIRNKQIYSRLTNSEGEEDAEYSGKIRGYICKELIFSDLNL